MADLEKGARAFTLRRHGNQMRRYEKLLYIGHLDRVVELADFADSTPSIVEYDTGFAAISNVEKRMVLNLTAANEGVRLTSLPLPLFRLASQPMQPKPEEVRVQ